MDYTPIFYLKTPEEAIASVSTLKIVLLLFAVAGISALFIWIYNRFIHEHFAELERMKPLVPGILAFLVLTGALIIPIRGGFGIAPINAGTVYFSGSMFLNHTAINAVWNVGTTALTQKPVDNPYKFSDQQKAEALFDSSLSFRKSSEPNKVLNTERPNVLMIILESFSAYVVGVTDGDSLVTPRLNGIAREGILFRNFYASGTRTDKAMPAILSGYPAQPAQSIIKEPKKSQSLPSLVRSLNDNGYRSSFRYGGEINFANLIHSLLDQVSKPS
jgi:phosphoglycerol transferase MdoB-like AlkP superfamily enzyme